MKIDYTKEELILSIKDVHLTYDTKPILNGVNIDIHNITRPGLVQGQIVSIVGRSGCGKSSLFKLLSGYNKATAGTILVNQDQHEVKIGEMGVVPQDYPLFNHRTVFENLSLALSSLKGKEKIDTINDYANHFELSEELKKYPCDLSGGQRQRVSILQQVLAGNRFILLDEPFSGLDTLMKDKVVELLVKVANLDELNTLVIVSHDIESACAISDTVFVLTNTDGNGSNIVKTYDFLTEGLAYQPGIKEDPRFRSIIQEIKTLL
jgi:ABC-type nitrate/sulfonate/bicarbonate transport system ATPase subunit